MVSYQTFVSLVFDEVNDDAEAPEVMSWAGERWSNNKDVLSTATRTEAKDAIRRSL